MRFQANLKTGSSGSATRAGFRVPRHRNDADGISHGPCGTDRPAPRERSRDLQLRDRPDGIPRSHTSDDQHGNWLDCIHSRKAPVAPAEIGHRACSTCLLHWIVMKVQHHIYWDPKTEMILGDAYCSQSAVAASAASLRNRLIPRPRGGNKKATHRGFRSVWPRLFSDVL